MAMTQEPKLEVPTIYKAYKFYVREYPHKIWPYMVQYLHFRILKFPLSSRGPHCVSIALDLWNVLKGKTKHMDGQRLHAGVILLGSVQFCPVVWESHKILSWFFAYLIQYNYVVF